MAVTLANLNPATFRMFTVLPCELPISKSRLGFVPRFSEIAIVKEQIVKLCEQDSCTIKRLDYGRLRTKNLLVNLLTLHLVKTVVLILKFLNGYIV